MPNVQDDRPEGDGEVGIGLALVAVRESPVIHAATQRQPAFNMRQPYRSTTHPSKFAAKVQFNPKCLALTKIRMSIGTTMTSMSCHE